MTNPGAMLPRRRLGRTGLEVTALSMGGAGVGRDNVSDDEAIEAVHRAIELGMNYLDTAPLYGACESERRIGLALAGGWREKIYLATKTGRIRNGVVTFRRQQRAEASKIAFAC